MKIDLELYLWEHIHRRNRGSTEKAPRFIIRDMIAKGMIRNAKQAWRTLDKWERLGAYDYGVTLDLGWTTQEDFPRAGKMNHAHS